MLLGFKRVSKQVYSDCVPDLNNGVIHSSRSPEQSIMSKTKHFTKGVTGLHVLNIQNIKCYTN